MLDANGNMVDFRQSYDSGANDKGLITLSGEGKAIAQTFTFDDIDQYPNATFQVQYSDLVIEESGEANTELGSLFCAGLLADINSVQWTQFSDGHYEVLYPGDRHGEVPGRHGQLLQCGEQGQCGRWHCVP